MSAGRCSGCGQENRSCQVIRTHINTCEEYRALFLSDPEKCLDPEDEFRRYKEWAASPEGQEQLGAEKAKVSTAMRERSNRRQVKAKARWA